MIRSTNAKCHLLNQGSFSTGFLWSYSNGQRNNSLTGFGAPPYPGSHHVSIGWKELQNNEYRPCPSREGEREGERELNLCWKQAGRAKPAGHWGQLWSRPWLQIQDSDLDQAADTADPRRQLSGKPWGRRPVLPAWGVQYWATLGQASRAWGKGGGRSTAGCWPRQKSVTSCS